LIVADVWHGTYLNGRDYVVTRSGPIPRLYDIPINLAAVFGKYLHKSGDIDEKERKEVSIFSRLYEDR